MSVDEQAFERFKKNVYQKTGIDLNYYKEKQMKRRLISLMTKRGFSSFEEYWEAVQKDKDLYREFLDRITINVSEFFRNPQRWDILENQILPQLISNNDTLNVWSAACSTGEEAYSLAMVLSEQMPTKKFNILGTDLDQQVLNEARTGIYTEERVKEVGQDRLKKYFKLEGNRYQVSDDIKKCVQFKKHDLLKDKFDTGFDLILCRNVMIYFTEEAKKTLYSKFHHALSEQGILFVGSTEQIFDAKKLGYESIATFFYRKSS